MSDFIYWGTCLIRRNAIDYVSYIEYEDSLTVNVLLSGAERRFTFNDRAVGMRKFRELAQKIDGTWVEDDPVDLGSANSPRSF